MRRRQFALATVLAGFVRLLNLEKLRAGNIVKIGDEYYRVRSNGRSQKAQSAASYHVKCHMVGNPAKTKEITGMGSLDIPDMRSERIRLLFSGFDDVDNACFVYPQFTEKAGEEVNLPATTLPDYQQKFLAVGMPCDLLRILTESEEEPDFFGEVVMPHTFTYTVDGLRTKGMYKIATLAECDGEITVGDTVNVGDKVKVLIRPDGTASFQGKTD